MAQAETVTITGPNGKQSPGEAGEVIRVSDGTRVSVGWIYIIGGCLLGVGCLAVPTPHIFITTWLFPLLGIYLGTRTLKRRVMVHDITCQCPACGKTIEMLGGSIDETTWQKCPECEATLTVQTHDAPVVPSPTPVQER